MKKMLAAVMIGGVLANQVNAASALDLVKSLKKENYIYSGVSFHYLDKEDRLLILNDLFKSIELEYALLPLKEKLIGLNYEKLKAETIALENNVEDVILNKGSRLAASAEVREQVTFLQAKKNLEFLDRMNILMAKFKDTHFNITEKIDRPVIYSPLRFYRVDGKVILGSIEKKSIGLAEKLSNGYSLNGITLGDELISIDGVLVEDRINELKKLVSASSDEFADYYAVRSLTIRNNSYPYRNFIEVQFKKSGKFKLPIFVNITKDQTPRLDALTYLKKLNITSDASTIGMNFDKNTRQWVDSNLTFDGYTPTKLHLNLKDLKEFMVNDGKEDSGPALRTGYIIKNGKSYGVMQLLTFMVKNVKSVQTQKEQTFLDAIRDFVNELKENNTDLILDLRINGGGNGNLPRQVLSILAPANTVYSGETSGYKISASSRNLEEPSLYQEIVAEDITEGLSLDEYKSMFQNTIDEERIYTPMFSYGPIKTDLKVNGFDKKIVALVTANCISACDKMSYLLKTNNRATIIGTHSNGTGAGFSSTSEIKTEWTDRLNVFSSRIPNHLFGIKGSDTVDQYVFENDSVERLCTENKPTVADVQYSPTMKDFTKNNMGWLEKAISVLEQ